MGVIVHQFRIIRLDWYGAQSFGSSKSYELSQTVEPKKDRGTPILVSPECLFYMKAMENNEADANESYGPAVCRVCLCSEASIPYFGKRGEPLISPCLCKGTMGLFHRSCLEHWLNTSRMQKCEICKFTFRVGSKKQGLLSYLRHKGWRSGRGRSILSDIFALLVLTPLAWGSAVLCLRSALTSKMQWNQRLETEDLDVQEAEFTPPEVVALIVMAVFLIFVHLTWVLVTFVFHFGEFRDWQNRHMKVYVIDDMDEETLIHSDRRPIIRKFTSLMRGILTRGEVQDRRANEGTLEMNQQPVVLNGFINEAANVPQSSRSLTPELHSSAHLSTAANASGVTTFVGSSESTQVDRLLDAVRMTSPDSQRTSPLAVMTAADVLSPGTSPRSMYDSVFD